MANESTASTEKTGAFNRMYFIVLAALIVLVLGVFLFFASTRQAHSGVSGAGTQKGMVAISDGTTAT